MVNCKILELMDVENVASTYVIIKHPSLDCYTIQQIYRSVMSITERTMLLPRRYFRLIIIDLVLDRRPLGRIFEDFSLVM